jgi:hypothetical protein
MIARALVTLRVTVVPSADQRAVATSALGDGVDGEVSVGTR